MTRGLRLTFILILALIVSPFVFAQSDNSTDPLIRVLQAKGVLTEAEKLSLDEFGEASFRNGNSALKSEIRYFGHRLDSVQQWEAPPSSLLALTTPL